MLCRHIFTSGITIKVPRPHLIAFSFRQNKILQKSATSFVTCSEAKKFV